MVRTAAVHSAVLLGTAVLTAGMATYAARRRLPATTPFAVLMASLTVWCLTYGVGLQVQTTAPRLLLLRLQWTAVPVITVALLVFLAAYTGTDVLRTRRSVALLGVVPAVTVLGAWTNRWHGLLWAELDVRVVDGMALIAPTFGPLFWVYTVYSYVLVLAAVALTVRLVLRSDRLYADQSVLLVLGIGAPFAVNVADVFLEPAGPKVDYTPVALAVTGLAFGYALFRRRLLDLVPATRYLGRHTAVDQLETGVVIVDTDREVVWANRAAEPVLGATPSTALGRDLATLVGAEALALDPEGGLAEYEQDDQVYELRSAPVTDRDDRLLGHTVVVHDVTARTRRERALADQRDELATLEDLNAVIRGVNRALVGARDRAAIAEAVCEHVLDTDLYDRACVGDVATWRGEADRWTVAGTAPDGQGEGPPSVTADGGPLPAPDLHPDPDPGLETDSTGGDAPPAVHEDGWTVVPLTYGHTVYGALGLYTERETVGPRELSVLGELGETIGHAIDAVETQQLLSAETRVEVTVACTDPADPLVGLVQTVPCRLSLAGLVPAGETGPVAYLGVAGAEPGAAREVLADRTGDAVRVLDAHEAGDDGPVGGRLEWRLTDGGTLGVLVDSATHLRGLERTEAGVRYRFHAASAAGARAVLERLRTRYDGLELVSKREHSGPGPAEEPALEGPDPFEELTDRQEEVLRAAYRAGYFEWPRDSNAEEVAEAFDISSAMLHSHLRKAEGTLLETLLGGDNDPADVDSDEAGPRTTEPEGDTETEADTRSGGLADDRS